MHAAELFESFKNRVEANPDFYLKDYIHVKEKVKNSSAIYKGEPVKFLYQPMFFTGTDIERFERLTSTLTGILDKVIDEYLKNPDFRKQFGFSPVMEKLILVSPGYSIRFPMARYDIFYHYSDRFKFCELNADGSSSMNESRVLHEIIGASHALDGINDVYDYEQFDTWIDCVIKNYIEFNGGKDDNPNIAIMDFEGEGIISEFEVFRNRFIERGYNTVICDPRELKYSQGKLYFGDTRIDLIYRRATTSRLVAEAEYIQDFIKAYMDGAVCVVGGLVSQIIHNKKLFAVLHDEQNRSLMTDEEKVFVEEHIPFTCVLNPEDSQLMERLISGKDNLVLKPFDLFAAYGVYIGRDFSLDEWKGKIKEASAQPYLVQELCSIPQQDMLTIEDGKLHFEKYNHLVGLFMYNHKFSGFYTRAGRKSVIASIAESFTLPNFVVNR